MSANAAFLILGSGYIISDRMSSTGRDQDGLQAEVAQQKACNFGHCHGLESKGLEASTKVCYLL